VLIIRDVQRFGLEPNISLAVIQGQINGYTEKPGIKAASGLESIDVLYYFDKSFLSKFRRIIGICTNFQDNVINAILISEYKAFHCCGPAKAALFNQKGILYADIISGLRHVCFLNQEVLIKTGKIWLIRAMLEEYLAKHPLPREDAGTLLLWQRPRWDLVE
jgi:hypothetical protein